MIPGVFLRGLRSRHEGARRRHLLVDRLQALIGVLSTQSLRHRRVVHVLLGQLLSLSMLINHLLRVEQSRVRLLQERRGLIGEVHVVLVWRARHRVRLSPLVEVVHASTTTLLPHILAVVDGGSRIVH